MSDRRDERVLVPGGAGFLGSNVVKRLRSHGWPRPIVPRRQDYDLRREEQVARLFADARPTLVVQCAGIVGGVAANLAEPGRLFYDNLMIGTLVMEHARLAGVRKLVVPLPSCTYPGECPVPFDEAAYWDGYPEPSSAPYALAKKMALVQGQAYRQQYGFNAVHLVLANLYGPGGDVHGERAHVIPALIERCLDAVERGAEELLVWGDGSARRDFLYVEDAAEAIVLAAERYDAPELVNVGSGAAISVRQIAEAVADACGFTGRIVWDTTRPSGQAIRELSVGRAQAALGFRPSTSFEEGLRRTVEWHRRRRAAAR